MPSYSKIFKRFLGLCLLGFAICTILIAFNDNFAIVSSAKRAEGDMQKGSSREPSKIKTVPTSSGSDVAEVAAVPGRCWEYFTCGWNVQDIPRPTRLRAGVRCTDLSAEIVYERIARNATPSVTSLFAHDPCLRQVAESSLCQDAARSVPRLVHYVTFSHHVMGLHALLSVLSAVRYMRPCLVLLHGDALPDGPYWDALLQLVPNIVHVRRERPRVIFGHVIDCVEHSTDVTRVQVLLEYGGLYLDTDQLVLRPLEPLRRYRTVIGTEVANRSCGNAMILSAPQAEFLALWLANYTSFNDSNWNHHSTVVPRLLSLAAPHLVHVVDSFFRPNGYDIEPLYVDAAHFDWQELYGMHLYTRRFRLFFEITRDRVRPDESRCVMGDVVRYILFGSSESCRR